MRQYNDDDIEVLGNRPSPGPRKLSTRSIAIGIIVAIIVIAAVSIICARKANPVNLDVADATEITNDTTVNAEAELSLPEEFVDSINNVVFTIIMLDGFKASVALEKPDSLADNVVLALTAADFRADNGEIVCEFIHNRKQLSRGVRKKGFCYVSPEGTLTIGYGDGEAHIKTALDNGGTFFRQYALVMDGEIQPNTLKGKSLRRALGFLDGKPAVVLSAGRESLYDFSQALADYGFSHAIYLPGGDGFLRVHSDKSDYRHDRYRFANVKDNYLVFKK